MSRSSIFLLSHNYVKLLVWMEPTTNAIVILDLEKTTDNTSDYQKKELITD